MCRGDEVSCHRLLARRRLRAAGWLASLTVLLTTAAAADEYQQVGKQYDAQYKAGRYREAEPRRQRMLALPEKTRADQPGEIAACLNELADLERALDLAEQQRS